MWRHAGTMFRWIFFQLPATSNFLLAAFGVAVIFAMKELDENLRERRGLRWGIGLLIFAFGITAFISGRVAQLFTCRKIVCSLRSNITPAR